MGSPKSKSKSKTLTNQMNAMVAVIRPHRPDSFKLVDMMEVDQYLNKGWLKAAEFYQMQLDFWSGLMDSVQAAETFGNFHQLGEYSDLIPENEE